MQLLQLVVDHRASWVTLAKLGLPRRASRLGRGRPLEYRRILRQLCLAKCVSLAELRVNTAPHKGQVALAVALDLSFLCLMRLLFDENSRPLQPWSQHRSLPWLYSFSSCFWSRPSRNSSVELGSPNKSEQASNESE